MFIAVICIYNWSVYLIRESMLLQCSYIFWTERTELHMNVIFEYCFHYHSIGSIRSIWHCVDFRCLCEDSIRYFNGKSKSFRLSPNRNRVNSSHLCSDLCLLLTANFDCATKHIFRIEYMIWERESFQWKSL